MNSEPEPHTDPDLWGARIAEQVADLFPDDKSRSTIDVQGLKFGGGEGYWRWLLPLRKGYNDEVA